MSFQAKGRNDRRGATLILMLFLIVVIIGIAAFAVDIGRVQLVRSQLQTAVDAGAIAGSLQLKQDPTDMNAALAAAELFVQQNRVGFMVTVPAEAITVEAGAWDIDTGTFDASTPHMNAIRVMATQQNEPYMFAGIFGKTNFSVPRQSIAVSGNAKMDIMMVLDLSSSMSSEGRIEALHAAAPTFIDAIDDGSDDDEIGVMCYGAKRGSYDPAAMGHTGSLYTATPYGLFPPGNDPSTDCVGVLESAITSDFDDLTSNVLNSSTLVASKYGGGTPIGAAIRDSAHYLDGHARNNTERFLVLMSDGQANQPEDDPSGYALDMAAYAAGINIRIYTISLGNSADVALMTAIANATGGMHFQASGSGAALTSQLTTAFAGVASSIKNTTIVQ